jgi:hypothetical protein
MSAERTKFWDIGNFTFVFLNIPIESGLGEGNVFTIETSEDHFTSKKGADGSTVRVRVYTGKTTVKVILLQTAAANAVLSAIHKLDTSQPNGAGVGPILLRDRSGNDFFSGSEAWIVGVPKTVTYGATAADREWTIEVADGELFLGGS